MVGRADLLCAVFFFVSLLFYVSACKNGKENEIYTSEFIPYCLHSDVWKMGADCLWFSECIMLHHLCILTHCVVLYVGVVLVTQSQYDCEVFLHFQS